MSSGSVHTTVVYCKDCRPYYVIAYDYASSMTLELQIRQTPSLLNALYILQDPLYTHGSLPTSPRYQVLAHPII